ncbi:MAG TPA: ATP-binding protein [Microthrixaceae bacterium]|mgnify:CR=1 FL=1|jgi:signal transduction histidine kinase|nr:ATP-binding protein [Microthrixaceae bacterium]
MTPPPPEEGGRAVPPRNKAPAESAASLSEGDRANQYEWRPLDGFRSIRTKLSVLVAGSVTISVLIGSVGLRVGWPFWFRLITSVIVGLGIMRLVSKGITSPLRDMASAARAMADGDYSRRVRDTSRDEVGELATAFNEMAAELAEVDRQRRELVANASHELRTPIAALQAMIENLADGVSEADPAFVDTMHNQVRRLAVLVDQLMSLSRLDSGEMPLHIETVSVAALVQASLEEFSWHHPDAEIEVDVEPETLLVAVDQLLMHRVIANLLENAIRHGAPPFHIAASLGPAQPGDRQQSGPTVSIVVSDGGPGIPAEAASQVFDRFHRLDRSRRSGGSGLGLAIVAGIVERHHGVISVEPNTPTGVRMVVRLPQDYRDSGTTGSYMRRSMTSGSGATQVGGSAKPKKY